MSFPAAAASQSTLPLQSTAVTKSATPIHYVCLYTGAKSYQRSVAKQAEQLKTINALRATTLKPWVVLPAAANIIEIIKHLPPKETLLVVPAGESSHLDTAFTDEEMAFLHNEFFMKGGRGYFNCGSAYWVSQSRIFKDLRVQSGAVATAAVVKVSKLPLFPGIATGPLCLELGKGCQTGFYSDAVTITDGKTTCSVYMSGGGSFQLPAPSTTKEKVVVVQRYVHSELQRLGKSANQCAEWQNAACMASIGEGAALFTMFHPYYSAEDIDVATCEKMFSGSGTNWSQLKAQLSSKEKLIGLVQHLFSRLDTMDFSEAPLLGEAPSLLALHAKK